MSNTYQTSHVVIPEVFEKRIETLIEAESWHVLDFIPFQPQGADFLKYERFLETSDYVKDFADRICFIALTLVSEYQADAICLTEGESFFEQHPTLKPFENLRQLPYEQLWTIIRDVIVSELSSIQIFFAKEDVLIGIDGALSVTLYNANEEFLHTVDQLAQRNGLYVKYRDSDGTITLL